MRKSSSKKRTKIRTNEWGWFRLRDVVRELEIDHSTVLTWVRQKLFPSRRIHKRLYLPLEAIRILIQPWPCPACREECLGPKHLAAHTHNEHIVMASLRWAFGVDDEVSKPIVWKCPAKECAKTSPFFNSVYFKEHMDEHVERRRRMRVGERRPRGRGGVLVAPVYHCRHPGCNKPFKTGSGTARGLCVRHYQQARLAGQFKSTRA